MEKTTTKQPQLVLIDFSPIRMQQPIINFSDRSFVSLVHLIIRTYPYGDYDTDIWETLEKSMDMSNMTAHDLEIMEMNIENTRTVVDNYLSRFFGKNPDNYAFNKFVSDWSAVFYYTGDLN